jgi:hypothetical protein
MALAFCRVSFVLSCDRLLCLLLTVNACVGVAHTIESKVCPPQPGVVRGDSRLAGFVIEPVPNSPNCSKLTFCAQLNLRGSLPSFITSKIYNDLPLCIAKLRPVLSKLNPKS